MSQIFLSIINMSISASYIVLAVLLLRLLLKKAPKWITVVLWGIVAIRLVCPFSIESVLSLIPSAETVSPAIMTEQTPSINTGIPIINNTINPIISESFAPDPGDSANPLQIWIPILTVIWVVGIAALLIYTVISYAKVKRKIGTAVLLRDNIYQSENVVSPFVLGVIKPKIYLPFNMSNKDTEHVVAHETAHIRRGDHLWKPLGFFLLTLHWFNPLMWLGYILLCRDIELACDEKVIGGLDHDARADYSEALLTCSVNRRMIAACPLAFGEGRVKDRVKSVLNYKKPAFWVILLAVMSCAAVAIFFLTDPPQKQGNEAPPPYGVVYTDYEGVYITISAIGKDAGGQNTFRVVWHNETDREILFGESFSVQRKAGEEWTEADRDEEKVFLTLGYILQPYTSKEKTYTAEHYELSDGGTYRLIVSFAVKEGEEYVTYGTWAEFRVGYVSGIELLKAKYPHFFGLNTENGLTVYVWQMAKDQYCCYLASTGEKPWTEVISPGVPSASIFDIRAILHAYGIEREKVKLCPIEHFASSYFYVIDDGYRRQLEQMFWAEIAFVERTPFIEYGTVYDTATFDIDGDGVEEVCSMSLGPTSGIFTFTFTVRETGMETVEYRSVIYSRHFRLSFQKGSDGMTRVKAVTVGETPETHIFDISVVEDQIYLTENGIPIGEVW